jgi:hypothetical protein
MKMLKDIEAQYLPLVERFLPHLVNLAAEIGYQIEMFRVHLESDGYFINNLRLKEEKDLNSKILYEEAQLK